METYTADDISGSINGTRTALHDRQCLASHASGMKDMHNAHEVPKHPSGLGIPWPQTTKHTEAGFFRVTNIAADLVKHNDFVLQPVQITPS